MDEQVLRSLIKWPNVPACFGWLALDRRGQWRMRDEYAQQNQLPGQLIQHTALNDFINRNYAADSKGRFFFQNGPQRVFVTLAATPWIARIIPNNDDITFLAQGDVEITPNAALCDEHGNIYIVGTIEQTIYPESTGNGFIKEDRVGVALLHDHDLGQFSELSKLHEEACSFSGSWKWRGKQLPLDPILAEEISTRFGFIQHPTPNNN
jgi:hypothetical protein